MPRPFTLGLPPFPKREPFSLLPLLKLDTEFCGRGRNHFDWSGGQGMNLHFQGKGVKTIVNKLFGKGLFREAFLCLSRWSFLSWAGWRWCWHTRPALLAKLINCHRDGLTMLERMGVR